MTPYTCIWAAGAPLWWPGRYPTTVLAYGLDISAAVDGATDLIASVSAVVAPSGSGEMQPTDLTVDGYLLSLTPTGGQPTRVYTIAFTVTMTDGNVYVFEVQQGCAPLLATDQPQIAPSPGFGPPIVWSYAPTLNFSNSRNSMYLPLL